MTDFPVEDALEQQIPARPDDSADDGDGEPSAHGDDVDPAEAYEADRVVPVDDDEWL